VSVILILILASLAMALLFLGGFIWAVRAGQYEDTCTPSMRILAEDARKVSAVAMEVGYDSEAAFSRAFKKSVGVSPAAWRDRRVRD